MLCSMDDPKLYGDEMYRIGFGEAVERNLLTDYKVLILTLNDKDVPPAVQDMLSDGRYRRRKPKKGQSPRPAQEMLIKNISSGFH